MGSPNLKQNRGHGGDRPSQPTSMKHVEMRWLSKNWASKVDRRTPGYQIKENSD